MRRLPRAYASCFTNVQVARADAFKYPELAERYSIKGFPTLVMFDKGEPVGTHRGRRTVEAMMSFLKKYV